MHRGVLNLLLDTVAAALLTALVGTGYLLVFVLPPRTNRTHILWGLLRHQWGTVHAGISVLLLTVLAGHVALHWRWLVMGLSRRFGVAAWATRLGRIGYDAVAGSLVGGMQALAMRPDLVQRTERITAATLAEQLAAPEPPLMLDVRAPREWQAAHITRSLNIPLLHLQERLRDMRRHRRLVVHCQSGYRSAIAASVLARQGFTQCADLVGGFAAWDASHLVTVAAGQRQLHGHATPEDSCGDVQVRTVSAPGDARRYRLSLYTEAVPLRGNTPCLALSHVF